jgi:hypothetical protein
VPERLFDWTTESEVTLIVLGGIFVVLMIVLVLVCCSHRGQIARPQDPPFGGREIGAPLISLDHAAFDTRFGSRENDAPFP